MPLFLELVRLVARDDPELARAALDGLAAYEQAERPPPPQPTPVFSPCGATMVRDHGGEGPPVVLIPSLINPPHILDLDAEVSLAAAIARMGRRVLLVDWGKASGRPSFSVATHVSNTLVRVLAGVGQPPAVIGYCLGGTMAIAAANLVPVERVVTLAAPWHFSRFPEESRASLQKLWSGSMNASEALGALPMEVMQGAFWSLDPERTVRKFAEFGRLEPGSREAMRFVALEDWANEGEPLPLPAARELIEDFFGADLPGSGRWQVGGRAVSDRLGVPALHFTAAHDRITPAATAAHGDTLQIPSGHVGMVVGSARRELHSALKDFLTPCR